MVRRSSPIMAPHLKPYSVVKNPSTYDEYKFELPELYREIAKEELREDDVVREQALRQMREWIADNPHIRKCRTDAKFLLRFLRFRKFSVPMACEALERYLTVRELYPTWFKNLDCHDPTMEEIFANGPFSLLGQDSSGRVVILFRFGHFNAQKHTALQDARFVTLLAETLLELEEMQIGGCHVLVEYEGCTLENFEKWSASEMKILMDAYSRSFPLRYSEINGFGLPKCAVPVVETLLAFANPKMREKIRCYSSVNKMEKHIEPTMNPKEYGGTADVDGLNCAFRKRMEEQREITLGLDQMEIDVEHYASVWNTQEPMPTEATAGVVFKQLDIV